MNIAEVTSVIVRPDWIFIRIRTDDGLVGYGEPTLPGQIRSVAQAVEELAPIIVGQDPRNVELLWQHLYRAEGRDDDERR